MYIKRENIPEYHALEENYIVYDNAKLIKADQELIKDISPSEANSPKECFRFCSQAKGHRCNFVEYHHTDKKCFFYDLAQNEHSILKFKNNDKELKGESFSLSTINQLKKQNISKEECIKLFEGQSNSIFYQYNEENSITECIVGLSVQDQNNSFAINLNSYEVRLNYQNLNAKFQVNPNDNVTKANKEASKEGNEVPYILVAIGIVGVIIITALVYYGIRMVKKANQMKEANGGNSFNNRNQIAYKIKNSDPSSYGSGSKSSGSNGRSRSYSQNSYNINSYNVGKSHSQHSTISNIAPINYDYDFEPSSSYTNSNIQDFYNNASIGYTQSNNIYCGNPNYGSQPVYGSQSLYGGSIGSFGSQSYLTNPKINKF